MIDEKVLIERLEEKSYDSMHLDMSTPITETWQIIDLKDAISIVKDLASEYNNGWISVEDELPPRNESVLCWAVSLARGGDCCCLGSCDNGFWFMQTQIDTYSFPQQYKVVAWHKLPEPYKKGE